MLPLQTFILSFSVFFFIIEKAGLFSRSPISAINVFYSRPFLAASLLLLLVTVIQTIMNIRGMKIEGWMRVLAVMLFVSGLWISHLTRFSAEVVLTEGQIFHAQQRDFDPGSVYIGPFTSVPNVGIKLENLQASFSNGMKGVASLEGSVRIISTKDGNAGDYVLRNGLPRLIKGTFMKLSDFGYSPRYELRSREGRVLDSSFIYMKLHPPGSEDSFRMLSPLTYYVRYYPEGRNGATDAVFGLRIVRNKDIVFNSDVTLSEEAAFENSTISFEEIRTWTKVSITRDWGEVVALGGLAVGIPGLLMGLKRKKKAES